MQIWEGGNEALQRLRREANKPAAVQLDAEKWGYRGDAIFESVYV